MNLRALFALLVALGAAPAIAQPAAMTYNYSLVPFYAFDSGLGSGGEAGFSGFFASFNANRSLDSRSTLGVGVRFDYEDWRFGNLGGFGGRAPWNRIYRPGISIPYSYIADGDWRFSFVPSVEYSGESGAKLSDSLQYGALGIAAKRFSPTLTMGLGVGVFRRIEQTRVIPYLVIDWRINDRLRLNNPFSAGPAGGAGLEIVYSFERGWEGAVGGAYRSYRFRLDDNGPFADGVGETRSVPIFARVSKQLGDEVRLDLYAIALTGSNLSVESSSGQRTYTETQNTVPMIGVTLLGRF